MSSPYLNREQTQVKHQLLGRYLRAAVPIIGSWAKDICYVDCLAGPWESHTADLSDTSFAVALNELEGSKRVLESRGKHPSFRCLFVEKNADAYAKLSSFSQGHADIEIACRPWDFEQKIAQVKAAIQKRPQTFAFIFIDPKGWKCASIELIKPLLQIPNSEVIINLMTSWIKRFLHDPKKNLNAFLGQDATRVMSLSGDEQEDELVQSYSSSVRGAGIHRYVCTMPVLKSVSREFHFHLVYATSNLKGVEEFKRAEREIVPFMHLKRQEARDRIDFQKTGQYKLLTPDANYTDPRYERYRERNLRAAESTILALLKTTAQISYDDL